MAIEFSLKIKGADLDENLILTEINNYTNISHLNLLDQNTYEIEQTYDILGFAITWVRNLNGTNNLGYETKFLNGNRFIYNQIIDCEFNKDFDKDNSYKIALKFLFGIISKIDSQALLTTSFFEELCFFNNKNSVIIDTSLKIWNNTSFYDDLKDWKYDSL